MKAPRLEGDHLITIPGSIPIDATKGNQIGSPFAFLLGADEPSWAAKRDPPEVMKTQKLLAPPTKYSLQRRPVCCCGSGYQRG